MADRELSGFPDPLQPAVFRYQPPRRAVFGRIPPFSSRPPPGNPPFGYGAFEVPLLRN